MGTEDKQPCANWDDHTFVEVYYGHRCSKCDLFYAFRCAPWDEELGVLNAAGEAFGEL